MSHCGVRPSRPSLRPKVYAYSEYRPLFTICIRCDRRVVEDVFGGADKLPQEFRVNIFVPPGGGSRGRTYASTMALRWP